MKFCVYLIFKMANLVLKGEISNIEDIHSIQVSGKARYVSAL